MATAIKTNPWSESEWAARRQLASCYRVFAHLGWDELIYNHITLRLEDEPGAFLINQYGLHYTEVKASNLIKIDIDGNRLDDSTGAVNPAGFLQHSLFHRHLPDAHCIMHTHTTPTMAVAATAEGIRPTNFYAAALIGQVAWHEFEGVTIRPEEGERLIANLGDKRIMMLRNHGPLVMAPTLTEAFQMMWVLQRACEIQVATGMTGGTPVEIGADVLAVHQRDLHMARAFGQPGKVDFEALVRVVDRVDPSWRD